MYSYCRHEDGRIGRRLLFAPGQYLAGERFPGDGFECWFLEPEVLGEGFVEISDQTAAAALGTAALGFTGEATELIDAEGARRLSTRAPWLIDAIDRTQRYGRQETLVLREEILREPERFGNRIELINRIGQLQLAYRTLYALWEELRLIQGHAMVFQMFEDE